MFRHIFAPILERFRVSEEQRGFIMYFYIHGLIAIISEWLKGDCVQPVSMIIQIMEKCVMGGKG